MAEATAAAKDEGDVDSERVSELAAAIAQGSVAGPDQLAVLRGRQEATEAVFTMLVASHPALDSLVDILASIRKVAAEATPPRREIVEAYDSYLSTLRMLQNARRQAQDSHRKAP